MGVPKAFSWIEKNIGKKKILQNSPDKNIDNLYIDANCLFHPMCFIVLGFYPNFTDKKVLEIKMMKRIQNYLDYIINVVNPQKQIMISVDGVAPQAKSTQQRYRRFRTIPDTFERESILVSHGITPPQRWYNTVITPGTEFMEILHEELIKYCKQLKDKKKVKIVYSSYHTNGEGEHKIMDDIRELSKDPKNSKDTYCIYGLDADLIFLALASQRKNIYLLREATLFGKPKVHIDYKKDDPVKDVAQELMFVSIDNIKEGIYELIKKKLDFNKDKKLLKILNKELVCNDYIFFSYFMGNDFVAHIPSLDISSGGLDECVKAYISILKKYKTTLLDEDKNLNPILIQDLFEYFSNREDYYFRIILPKFVENSKKRKHCPSTEPHKRQLWELENMMNIHYEDPIKLGVDEHNEYKRRYYEHYFKVDYSNKRQVNKVCYEYLRALKWINVYYFTECPSFSWKYPYQVAPFASDLFEYCKTAKTEDITFSNHIFEKTSILTPFQQLLSVLPSGFSELLPSSYKSLVKYKNMEEFNLQELYPTDFKLDYINKLVYFKCYPRIPQVDVQFLLDFTKGKKFTEKEKKRNIVCNNFIY